MELIEDELEMLRAVFPEDGIVKVMETPLAPNKASVAVTVHPATMDSTARRFVSATLGLHAPEGYPDVPLAITLDRLRGIDPKKAEEILLDDLRAVAVENEGGFAMGLVVDRAREIVTECNVPHGECCVCMEALGGDESGGETGGEAVQTACGHAFHARCLARWLLVVEEDADAAAADEDEDNKGPPREADGTVIIPCPYCRAALGREDRDMAEEQLGAARADRARDMAEAEEFVERHKPQPAETPLDGPDALVVVPAVSREFAFTRALESSSGVPPVTSANVRMTLADDKARVSVDDMRRALQAFDVTNLQFAFRGRRRLPYAIATLSSQAAAMHVVNLRELSINGTRVTLSPEEPDSEAAAAVAASAPAPGKGKGKQGKGKQGKGKGKTPHGKTGPPPGLGAPADGGKGKGKGKQRARGKGKGKK